MAMVQQSIEINVPVHTAYNQLTQFEDFPRFMEEVEIVEQLDDTHLHWRARMSDRPVEWDAEITEQEPDRCIAWRNLSGPTSAGKIEVQSVDEGTSRVTLTLESAPGQVPGTSDNDSEQQMAQQLQHNLARLKDFIEARGSATGAWRGAVHDTQVTTRDRDAQNTASRQEAHPAAQPANEPGHTQEARPAPAQTSSFAAGSEGWSGDEDPAAPVTSASQTAAGQRNDSAGSAAQK